MEYRYFKSLDGFRTIAVLAVMLVHWGFFGAGWIGVQMFFVLSGYLISQNLLRDRISSQSLAAFLKNFYWRRFLRIFPLYYAYIAIYILVGVVTANPPVSHLALALLTYTINIYSVLPWHVDFTNIGHFWSLAVEEQFYLFWPLLIFFIPKSFFRKFIVIILFLVPLLRLAAFFFIVSFSNDTQSAGEVINVMPIFQVDAFAAGAAVALFPDVISRHSTKIFWGALSVGCVAGAFNMFVLLINNWSNFRQTAGVLLTLGYPWLMLANFQFVWGYSVLNIISGTLIWSIVKGKNPLAFLDNHVLTYLGRISYGVYVLHVPIQGLIILFFPAPAISIQGAVNFLLYFVLTFAAAHVSFQFFEKRFLSLKDRFLVKTT